MNAAEQYLASVIGQQALEIAGLRQQLAQATQQCAKLGADVQDLKDKLMAAAGQKEADNGP